MNIFKRDYPTDPETEALASETLAPIANATPSPDAADSAQRALASAVALPAGRAPLGFQRRLVLGAAALVAPLMAVGAVGAATGTGPLDTPVDAVANAVGIGGNSGDHRQDIDNRAEQSEDFGQPGSCPGKACDAPGHGGGGASIEATGTSAAADEDGPGKPEKTPKADKTPKAEKTANADANSAADDAHSNGHGCDDKLFGEGDPPFGGHDTPVGPCKDDDDGAAPTAGTESAGPGNSNGKGNSGGQGQGNGGHQGGPNATSTATTSTTPVTSSGHGNGRNR
jgi:hypothetical protein